MTKNKLCAFRLPLELKKEIEQLAKNNHLSQSDIVRMAIINFIEINKWRLKRVKK